MNASMERRSLLLAKCGRENSTTMSPSKTSLGTVIEDSSMGADEPSLHLESLLRLSFSSPQVEKAHSTHDRLGTRSRSVVFNQGVAATIKGPDATVRLGGLDKARSRSERHVKEESLRRLHHLLGGDPEESLDERNIKNILGITRPSFAVQHSSMCLLNCMKKEDLERLRWSSINSYSAVDSLFHLSGTSLSSLAEETPKKERVSMNKLYLRELVEEKIRKHQSRYSVKIQDPDAHQVSQLPGEEESSSLDFDDLIPHHESMSSSLPPEFASFGSDEVVTDEMLGQGTFCQVLEIRKLQDSCTSATLPNSQSRSFLTKHCLRSNGDARYAVKRLRAELWDDGSCDDGQENPDFSMLAGAAEALVDLIAETSFLLQLEHPNIVRIRAIAQVPPSDPNFFLVMDRLYDTLEERMRIWRTQAVRNSATHQLVLGRQGRRMDAMNRYRPRINDALALCQAVQYLHDRRIIHRDLKPANIGYDARGNIKIFDFGLARQMAPCPRGAGLNEKNGATYRYSKAGSLRYMAPEVILRQPYNKGVDVYSLSLIIWQMLTLAVPYNSLETERSFERSIALKNLRPPLRLLPPLLAKCIKPVLSRGWQGRVQSRSTISELRCGIRHVLDRLHPSVCEKPCRQCGCFRFFWRLSSRTQKRPYQYPSKDMNSSDRSSTMILSRRVVSPEAP
jgi:serine/threonine protein kinase